MLGFGVDEIMSVSDNSWLPRLLLACNPTIATGGSNAVPQSFDEFWRVAFTIAEGLYNNNGCRR